MTIDSGERRTLLIVEDSATQALALEIILESAGYAVQVARSAEDALVSLRTLPADLVLSDVVMPGESGFALCRAIKNDPALRDIPVVLLTSLADPRDVVRGLAAAADNYITKPYAAEHLLSRLRRVFDDRDRRRAESDDDGLSIVFLGEPFSITSSKAQILDLLVSSFEELARANDALRTSQDERARQLVREKEARATAEATANRLRLLHTVSDAALADPSLEGFMDTVLSRVEQGLGVDGAAILTVGDGGGQLVFRAGRGVARPATDDVRVSMDSGLIGRMIASGDVFVAHGSGLPAEQVDELLQTIPAALHGSMVGAPLLAAGRPIGALLGATVRRREFTEDDGRLLRLLADRVALAVDRSELYERERAARLEAESANRAKSEFLAAMSHDFRTPLNAIGGYTDLMAMGLRGPVTAEQHEYFDRIKRNQQHLLVLVNDVLNFAHIERGKVTLRLAEIPVGEMLTAIRDMVEPLVNAKELDYVLEAIDQTATVLADRERVEQVLSNLLTNAVKFTPHGGRISVQYEEAADFVAIHVCDTGIGIPRDKLEAIFDPFVQVDSGRAGAESGIGLGLAISRNLARLMGGDLLVESVLGEGSKFTVTLPRGAAAVSEADTANRSLLHA